ncbi:MAG: aspartate kinase [Phycisphaerales bacterium]|nr:MAG: aspartate kinase [Phycisphaerales bacterium]
MPIIVQKYGGSSLVNAEAIRRCAARAVSVRRAGHDAVVVVSATGNTTDNLSRLADQVSAIPDTAAMDLLLAAGEQISTALMTMAIQSLGADAVGLAGSELGITTDDRHGEARIVSVDVERYLRHLSEGRIVVAAGFQGMSETGRLTTLGRGGSDITAVALAAALDVVATGGACEIYTDVDGVFTADPRIVPDARRLDRIDARHMLALAAAGAGVLHARAVGLALHRGLPLHIRHSMSGNGADGTVVEVPSRDERSGPPMIVGCALAEVGGVTCISAVGSSLQAAPQFAVTIFEALEGTGIELISATTSDTEVSCVVPSHDGKAALGAVHDALSLGEVRTGQTSIDPPPVLEFVIPSQISESPSPIVAGAS